MEGFPILLLAELARAPQSRQGASSLWRRKSDVFKPVLHVEQNTLEKFQIYFGHLGCFILKIVEGFLILFLMELARAPQVGRGIVALASKVGRFQTGFTC